MEIYFRNPDSYANEMRESNVTRVSWDLGRTRIRSIDVIKWAGVFMPGADWRMLVIGIEGTAEYSPQSKTINRPIAVYPTWQSSSGIELLENFCKKPVGEDESLYDNADIEKMFRPVKDQPHRVVIYDPPNIQTGIGKEQFKRILEVKEKYPDVEFIVHDTAAFRILFGSGFEYGIFDPMMLAARGSIVTPGGTQVKFEDLSNAQSWVNHLGFSVRDLRGDRSTRVLFNIESARWARANFNRDVNFAIRATQGIDPGTENGHYEYDESRYQWLTGTANRVKLKMEPDDGIICDMCSLSDRCKFYREGAVCSVPGTDSSDLTKMFGTRDANQIIDGLLEVTKIQATRVGLDLVEEAKTGERSVITDKRLKDLFDSGQKVAKLIDPKLSPGGATVNIGMIGGSTIVAQQTPQELMANAVRELERNGVAREDITPGMIRGLLEGMANRGAAREVIEIEAGVVDL